MDADADPGPRSIQGQVLRHSEHREVAIFLRDGVLWIADFIDGKGTLVDAATWFRFNCGSVSSSHARRRMVLESAVPLSPELVARIGRLRDAASDCRRTAPRWLRGAAVFRAPRRAFAAIARFLHPRRTR